MTAMQTTTKSSLKKIGSSSLFSPVEDAERIALLVVQEAKRSFPRAMRVVIKLIAMSTLGFVLASHSLGFSRFLVPIGIVFIAISLGWLDVIREECSRSLFFPDEKWNSAGAAVFRWQWLAASAGTIFAVSALASTHNIYGHLWSLAKYAAVPISLMLMVRSLEPFGFKHARSDILKAERLVRQLVSAKTASEISVIAPIVELDKIPLYKLGSVAALLRKVAASCEARHKLTVELDQSSSQPRSSIRQMFSMVFAPFRKIASELFLWESRDIVLYGVVALYVAVVYISSFHHPWTPLCILLPFMGPKSSTGRYLRSMQEDIRVVQGASLETRRSLTPEETPFEGWAALNWPMIGYLATVHFWGLYAIVVLTFCGGTCPFFGQGIAMKWQTGVWAFIVYVLGALGITAGVHRLWSHKSYKAGLPLRILLMIMNSVANQGTIFHWARDHRVHHLYSDTVADPHDANRGFWFSHVGWLLFKKHPAVTAAGKRLNLNDLYGDPVVMFQKKADPFWNLMWCFALPAFPALYWGDSVFNGFLLAGALRYTLNLHATWAVNSVVHNIGTKPYNSSHKTTENGWVSFFALGEGWHNWHHAFAFDYATAELGALQQFNPTKVFIDIMCFLGLAWGRRRAHDLWARRKAQWEEKSGRPVIESLEGFPLFRYRVVTMGPHPVDGNQYGEDGPPLPPDEDAAGDSAKED
eukprot:gnl/TRDRNA2_/TRDRNA2_181014_c0_seq1.p1 gnl/TRDRNA2_/TRDRNA2_181014_c0~~gnl/TRDRNA2_/TRDRNA2_181014_c0_seq1.p1  ORF type:complete len:697 (-),score=76.18 gnl/TRDRNA2_/TRDRNA2_181014_c0_seq1:422-2512(-)